MPLAPFDRARMVEQLRQGQGGEPFDVVVIGGGITGAGVALDAATRGLSVALVERRDFASGTSSKSSKLAHGGLRYLQQGEIKLVYEALHERQRMLANAPHLVHPLPFLIPVTSRGGVVSRKVGWALGKALWMYDLTGGARIGKRHQRVDAADVLAHVPTMPSDRVAYGFVYYDAGVDDARLTLAVARTAAAHGAVIANDVPVVALMRDGDGRASGVTVVVDDRTIDVPARVVVNATGVWTDDVAALEVASNDPGEHGAGAHGAAAHEPTMRPAKGIHITVPWAKVRNDIAVVIPVPKDKRSLFVVPWLPRGDGTFELTYVGTTDTDYDGPLDEPACTPDDVAYVLRALNASITTGITDADVVSTWAGLRPLVASAPSARTADLSRRHIVKTSDSGMITVAGGKLTTYRRMAADAVDVVMRALGRSGHSRTAHLALVGAPVTARRRRGRRRADRQKSSELPPPDHLAARYGTEADTVRNLIDADARLSEPLVPGLPYVAAEAIFAVRHEMARTLADVLDRRTRARLQARDATAAAAEHVARLIAPELDWDEARIAHEVTSYRAAVAAERAGAGLPDTTVPAALRARATG